MTPPDVPEPRPESNDGDAIRFVLQFGHALHRYGTPAHRIEEAMTAVASRLGVLSRFVATPTAVFASFGPLDALRTTLMRVSPGEMNLERLSSLDALTTQVVAGKVDPAEGARKLDAIVKAPPHYGPLLTILCWGLSSGTAAHLYGGGLKEIGVSAVIGFLLGIFAFGAERMPALARMFEPVAAFSASALSILGTNVVGPYSTEVTTLASLVYLLPGLTLVISMTEMATRNLIAGTTRISGALTVFMQLGFGVALGRALLHTPPPATITPLPDWTIAPVLVIITVSLSVLFRARMKDAVLVLIAGTLAYLGARIGAKLLGGPQLGAFIGAVMLGVGSNSFARLFDRPAIITLVPGIMLLVPGAVGFRSLEKMMSSDVMGGISTAFYAGMVLIAIVAGTLLANTLVPPRKIL